MVKMYGEVKFLYSKDVAKDFVYSFKKIGRESCDFLKFLKENKLTCFLCCFFLLLSYGPKWIFYNISADTEIMINDYNGMTSV